MLSRFGNDVLEAGINPWHLGIAPRLCCSEGPAPAPGGSTSICTQSCRVALKTRGRRRGSSWQLRIPFFPKIYLWVLPGPWCHPGVSSPLSWQALACSAPFGAGSGQLLAASWGCGGNREQLWTVLAPRAPHSPRAPMWADTAW